MSNEQAGDLATGGLLSVMAGAGAYDYFKAGSDMLKDCAPYFTAIAFVMVFIINWQKIKAGIRNARKPNESQQKRREP